MLNQKTRYTFFKVGEKRFRAVELTLDSSPNQIQHKKPREEKKPSEKEKTSFADDEYDTGSGWINVENGVPDPDQNKIYEDEIDCRIKLPLPKRTIQEDDEPNFKADAEEAPKDFTHFFSVPLNFKGFKDQFLNFKTDLYRFFEDRYKENLQNENHLHLTLMMLKLDEAKLKQIDKISKQIQEEILGIVLGEDLELEFTGCGMFKRKVQDSGLIYVGVKDNRTYEVLRLILNTLIEILAKEKIIDPSKDLSHIKYNKLIRKYELEIPHVTLLKSSWDSKSAKPKQSNLKPVFEKVKNFAWKKVPINHIDLSIRGKYGEDGFYKPYQQFKFE